MSEPAVEAPPATEPKYTPRSAAADFVKGLPKLGFEEPAVEPPVVQPKLVGAVPEPTAEPAVKTSAATQTPPAVVPAEVKMPRTTKDWDAFKAAEKTRLAEKDAELSKYKTELETLRKAPPVATIADDDPRILSYKKEAEELNEKLRLVEITSHPKFKAYYDGKVNAQVEMAKRIVGTEQADAIATLLKLPDNPYRQEKIEELVATLSPLQQSRVGGVLNTLNEIETERSGQIEQAQKDYIVYQEKTKADAELKQKEKLTKADAAFSAVVSTLQNPNDKDGLFIFQKKEGDEEWNKGVEERVKYAKDLLFSTNDPKALIRAALHAAALPGVVKSYQVSLDKISELAEQVKGLTAAQPNLESRGVKEGGEKAPGSQQKKPGKFLDGRGQAADFIKSLNQEPGSE
jgi:hypothetical protein